MTRHFPVIFWRQGVRSAWRHPVLSGLNVASIALGVAVFLAIQIANRSANESFRAGIEMVAGRANLEVRGEIDERIFPLIRKIRGVRAATPLVEGVVTLPGNPGEYLRIVGLDPFTGTDLRTFELLGSDRETFDLEAWLREPGAIAISRRFSEEILPRLESPIRILAGGAVRKLQPAHIIEPADAAAAGDPRIVAMDVGWAQELFGKVGELTAILLLVEDAEIARVAAEIRELVPEDVSVRPPARRGEQVESMLRAFQLNLTALSLVSVLVGAFLIYNTISASVVRRQPEIGILRALGASRTEIRVLFLGEAACAGAAGAALGILLALPLASALAEPVARTISSLYITLSIEELFLSPIQLIEGAAVGIGAALVAAWAPASEAANCAPARVLHPGSVIERFRSLPKNDATASFFGRVLRPGWTVGGIGLLALACLAGAGSLMLGVGGLGFASAFFVLAGFSLLAPAAIRTAAGLATKLPRFWRLAAQNLARAVHRNSVTVAALAAAISMTIGIAVMIHSFRNSVDRWITATLVADLFIGSAANEIASARAALPEEAVAWLEARNDVRSLTTFTERPLNFRGERAAMAVVDGPREKETYFLGGNGAEKYRRFLQPGTVAVSEPFATRFDMRPDDTLTLATPRGNVEFAIAGVYRDYARNEGTVMLTRQSYERWWKPAGVQSVGVTLEPGADSEALVEGFRQRFGDEGQFSIYSNRQLRERIFQIFEQTFAVTFVLRSISVVVAAAGVMLALLILAAEREREIGLLRAIGASTGQVVGLFLREAALIGLVSSILGVASGACLALVLTWVVNKVFFGWSIDLSYPVGLLASTPLWIVPVAVAAAILPAWRASRVPPAAALRFE